MQQKVYILCIYSIKHVFTNFMVVSLGYPLGMFGVSFGAISSWIRVYNVPDSFRTRSGNEASSFLLIECGKMQVFCKKGTKNLRMCKKSSTFAAILEKCMIPCSNLFKLLYWS